ncbi:hypothetical protein H1R20_g5402, partial [Candolleomyces eurysporus]
MSTQPLLQRTATKRIALPVRVEPKVSFANERTFLSWLHFTVVLGGLAVGLLNFGDKVGKISAAMFSAVGYLDPCHVSQLWPSWYMPSTHITGAQPQYEEVEGDPMTTELVRLFFAVVVNFVLRFTEP